MRAGKLNKRILIQSPAAGQDEYGEPTSGWVNVFTEGDGKVWASINDVSGREFIAAGGVKNAAQTKIGIRYRAGLNDSMRVMHGAIEYKIHAILGQDKKSLLLMCERVS